jgi:hypothetical protein
MKPRSDSKLKNLPEERQAQLADWLLSGLPYHQVREMIAKEFGVTTSLGALSVFYGEIVGPEILARRRRAVSTADAVAKEASREPGRFDQATIDALKQRAFELSIAPQADPRDVKNLFALVLKARDQDRAEADLRLARDRFEFDAARLCLEKLPELRAIAGNTQLDTNGKIDEVRRKLFGTAAPAAQPA